MKTAGRRYILSAMTRILCAIALSAGLAGLSSIVTPAQTRGETGGGTVRIPIDSTGYATTKEQIENVVRLSGAAIEKYRGFEVEVPEGRILGGICPHDDYIYAGPVYQSLMGRIDVPLVVLVGVSHKARHVGVQGRLIFDSFSAWRGPLGDLPVSPIRDELISRLPPDMVMISNELHATEHSIEGLVPFVQYNRACACEKRGEAIEGKLEILPVLITRLAGESFESTLDEVALALYSEMERRNMKLGRDYVVLVSADCVHYGDDGWGTRTYAPFGVDREGYEKAVKQDIDIARSTLTGVIDDSMISRFREKIDNFSFEYPYKIPWCGVYSIPFGVSMIERLCRLEGREPPEGILLDYSTSIEPDSLGREETGLGATNVATLRHWVGYTSVGYW